jgi:hypothetical protein
LSEQECKKIAVFTSSNLAPNFFNKRSQMGSIEIAELLQNEPEKYQQKIMDC